MLVEGISSSLLKQSKKLNPPLNTIEIGSELRNWVPDTDASSHFTPCLSDMKEVEKGLDLGVEVADGRIVQCTGRVIVEVNTIADDGLTLKAFLHGVIHVPGLKRLCNCFCQYRSLCYCEKELDPIVI
jgi:hypothetical protein